jgi:hypothetical protein
MGGEAVELLPCNTETLKTMKNKLKLGHSVIAWSNDISKAVKGKYVRYVMGSDYPHHIMNIDGFVITRMNCILDPEATEFLSGDEVEVYNYPIAWERAKYIGCYSGLHYVKETKISPVQSFSLCRYPKPEPKKPEQPDHKLAELIEKTAELMELLNKFGKSE